MIKLTDAAVEKLKEIADAEGVPLSVRFKVQGGGCAGLENTLLFDVPNQNDEVIEQDNIKIVIDQLSFQYLQNVTLDYVCLAFDEGFKFINPDIKNQCGCQKSYSY